MSGSFGVSFTYLTDPLIYACSWYPVVTSIVYRNFQYYLSILSTSSHNLAAFTNVNVEIRDGMDVSNSLRQQCLEEHLLFFLVHMCSRFIHIRTYATLFQQLLVDRFPYLMWNGKCLTMLLNLLQLLYSSVTVSSDLLYHDETKFTNIIPDNLIHILSPDISDERSVRKQTLGQLSQVAHVWLLQARSASASVTDETVELLQRCVQSTQHDDHIGVSLALQLGVMVGVTREESKHLIALSNNEDERFRSLLKNARHMVDAGEYPHYVYSRGSNIVNSFGLKERYLGELHGLYSSYKIGKCNKISFGNHELQRIQNEFNEITSRKKPSNSNVNTEREAQIDRLVYRAAALLVFTIQLKLTKSFDSQTLLHLICMMPAQIFTSHAIKAGIFAWDWILSVDQTLELPLLNELRSGWAYTVQHRFGLFSGGESDSDSSALEARKEDSIFTRQLPLPHLLPKEDGLLSHTLWIKFLDNQFEIFSGRNDGCVLSLSWMMHTALADPHKVFIMYFVYDKVRLR